MPSASSGREPETGSPLRQSARRRRRVLLAGTSLALCLALSTAAAPEAGPGGALRLVRPGKRLVLGTSRIATRDFSGHALLSPRKRGVGGDASGDVVDDRLVAFHVEFADAASCRRYAPAGATVFHRFQKFAGVFVPVNRLDDVIESTVAAPGFQALEDDDLIRLPPRSRPKTAPPSKAVPEVIVRGGLGGSTGRGVLVGIVDSGVDFRHEDFLVESAGGPRSRIVAYWDAGLPFDSTRKLGRPGPITYPDGRPVGTVFTGAELTQALRTGDLRDVVDRVGHGTACAGIAVGNGRSLNGSREVMGVAPDAGLLVVRAQTADELPGLSNFVVAPGVRWMASMADSLRRPLVISCSFGQQTGRHDGSRLIERELEALVPDAAVGRALVVSAGNDGATPIHVRMALNAKPQLLTWQCGAGDALLELHVRARDTSAVVALIAERSDDRPSEIAPYPLGPIVKGSPWRVFRFRVGGEIGGLYLSSTAPGVAIEAYISGGGFDSRFAVPTGTVASPGTCRAAITVGSYDWNDLFDQKGLGAITLLSSCDAPVEVGELSCYSSRGFVRPGLVKPDLVAPGQWFTAPVSLLASDRPAGLDLASAGVYEGLHGSGRYRWFNGTSAAAPYVAGVVALALDRSPRLTFGALRSRLRASLSHDATTGAVPNTAWGYGRLDLAAARRFLGLGAPTAARGR